MASLSWSMSYPLILSSFYSVIWKIAFKGANILLICQNSENMKWAGKEG